MDALLSFYSTVVNPARAGMILEALGTLAPIQCKPRASGDDPEFVPLVGRRRGVNPARAGMILKEGDLIVCRWCKPRASGDDPATDASKTKPPQ